MNITYERLPLVDLSAPRVLSQKNRGMAVASEENLLQDSEDAARVINFAGLNVNPCRENVFDAKEKYMVETQPVNGTRSSETSNAAMRQKGVRKPHYTRILVFENCFIFQAACCLPLKIIAASLDGNPVLGKTLYGSHSEQGGGKLVYEFIGRGNEIIIDLKRGDSTRAQRLIFDLNYSLATKVLSRKI